MPDQVLESTAVLTQTTRASNGSATRTIVRANHHATHAGHFDLKAIDVWMDKRAGLQEQSPAPQATSSWRGSQPMGKIKLRHYAVRKGRGYWLVTPKTRARLWERPLRG
jgi:hypothetical protein